MTLLVVAMLAPWVAGVACLVLDARRRATGWLAIVALAVALASLVGLTLQVASSGPVTLTTGDWPAGVGISLRADMLGLFFCLLSLAMLTAATVHELLHGVREREFLGMTLLLGAGLTGAFLTADLFNFYVFFELALAGAYVLATYGRSRRALGAGLVFTAVNLLGTFVFLISVAAVYRVTGTLDMETIGVRMADVDANAAVMIAVGFFVAFGVKLGLFPFHFWLPTVYTDARPAVAAILAGSLANIGVYGLLRFGGELLPRELQLAAGALIVIGSASILYGAVLAVSRRNAGEVLAYSAIGQVGYVLVAIGIGGPVGFAAAIVYTAVNSLNKTMLFLSRPLRGVIIGAIFALGALSVAGVPPAVGFIGKLELLRAAARDPVLLALLVAGSVLSLVYIFRIYQFEHWRAERDQDPSRWQEAVVPIALALVVVAVGIWPEPLIAFGQAAASVLTVAP